MTGKDARIVFMGTPDFAVASLKSLVDNGYRVVGVITAPDKPAGRGQQLSQSAVKQYALSQDLSILQPEKLKDELFIEQLKALKPDLQVVVAFRMLPEVVWALPSLGTFNLHASLLPKYRGAAPINHAIINGETETGVTTFLLQQEIDTGSILFQERVIIDKTDNVEIIHDRLMHVGSELVLKTVNALAEGNYQAISQHEIIERGIAPTPAPKIFKDNCLIDWNQTGEKINNFIRGLSPYPAAWTNLYNLSKQIQTTAKIFKSHFEEGTATPGKIETDLKKHLKIGCKNGWIVVHEIQIAGKKRLQIEEFLRGNQQMNEFSTLQN